MKAVILTTQRTGSSFLVQCLDSHPQVRCYPEILIGGLYRRKDVPKLIDRYRIPSRLWRWLMSGAWRPTKLLDDFYTSGGAPVMAFKAMYDHLRDPRARRYLCHHTEIRVIHLWRQNPLKQYVSKVVAKKRFGSRVWGTSTPVPVMSTRISPVHAIKEMQRAQNLFKKHQQLFSTHRITELVYETMIDGQELSDEAAAAVTDLLELDPAPLRARALKVNPDRLELIVENYDELERVLRETEFGRFLD